MANNNLHQDRSIEAIVKDEFIAKAAKDFADIFPSLIKVAVQALEEGNLTKPLITGTLETGKNLLNMASDANRYNEIINLYKRYGKNIYNVMVLLKF